MMATLSRFERPDDQRPPMAVMPMKTMALVIMPARMVNTSGMRDDRMAPPATYCSDVMQIRMTDRPMTLMMRAFLS